MIELYDLIAEMNDQEICELIETLREEIRALEESNRAIWHQYQQALQELRSKS